MQRILLTGGTGFAGSHLIEFLLSQGITDIHTTTASQPSQLLQDWLPTDHFHKIDLLDREATNRLIQELQPEQIYHLAAMAETGSSFEQAEKTIVTNIVLQLNLLEAVRQFSPHSRILVVGSGQEYDVFHPDVKEARRSITENHPLGPSNPYAVSKVSQDLLALSYHYSYQLDVVRARPFNHIGERQTPQFAVASFAEQIAKIEKNQQAEIRVGNLAAERDFTDVKDVVRAYHLIMQQGRSGEVYNVGTGRAYSMQHVLDTLISFSTQEIRVVTDPERFRPLDIPTISADSSKIQALGWHPVISLEDSLHRILDYWRDQITRV